MKNLILVIELRKGYTQALLINKKGQAVGSARQEITESVSPEGWKSYDPLEITYSVRSAIQIGRAHV